MRADGAARLRAYFRAVDLAEPSPASDLTAETALRERIRQELADGLDQESELELDDQRLDASVDDAPDHSGCHSIERVMGFCTEEQYREFFQSVPVLERLLMRSGIIQIKYCSGSCARWTSRCEAAGNTTPRPRKRCWSTTHLPNSRWWIVDAVDKKRARLNCISHLLDQIPHREVQHEPVLLPPRVHNPDYPPGTDPTRDARTVAFLNAPVVRPAALARIYVESQAFSAGPALGGPKGRFPRIRAGRPCRLPPLNSGRASDIRAVDSGWWTGRFPDPVPGRLAAIEFIIKISKA